MAVQRHGKKWRARVGGNDARWHTFDRKKDADEWELETKRNRQRELAGLPPVKPAITYEELCKLWEQNFDPSPWHLDMLAHSRKRFGQMMVRSIQPEAIGRWIGELDKAEKTKSHILGRMRQVLIAGVEWGYLTRSPARSGAFKVPSQHARSRAIMPFESWDDVVKVAHACDELDGSGPLVRFIAATGLTSPGEWRDARWLDIDKTGRSMVVHGTKTANRQRTIPLGAKALEALSLLPAPLRQDQHVFQGKRGERFDYFNWRRGTWRLALASAGQEYRTPNELRHTFAVLALTSGVPIDAVASILGHANVDITFRYYRKWTKSMAHKARDILDSWGQEGDEDGATPGTAEL